MAYNRVTLERYAMLAVEEGEKNPTFGAVCRFMKSGANSV
jgi:hypothetical protein